MAALKTDQSIRYARKSTMGMAVTFGRLERPPASAENHGTVSFQHIYEGRLPSK